MLIQKSIHNDLLYAMKSGDGKTRDILRLMEGVLRNKEIELRGLGQEMTEEDVVKVLSQQIKQRKESIRQYQLGGRDDLVKNEQGEVEVIEKYLPERVSQEKIDEVVTRIGEEIQPKGSADMGKMIGSVMQALKGEGLLDGGAVRKSVESYIQSVSH